jgi:pectin methylesterase-like acyl-CoA thioesterase
MLVLLFGLAAARNAGAATYWTAGGGADTSWSTGANWLNGSGTGGVPGSTDNVVFGDAGNATAFANISNVVDSTSGNFAGTISSLAFTNSVGFSWQNMLIASGLTLTITNNTGPFGSALFLGSPTVAVNNTNYASIQGPGATLNINSPNGLIDVMQVGSSSSRSFLILSNLDTLVANVSRVAVGSDQASLTTAAGQGTLYLARTNFITTTWVGNYSSPYTINVTNAIDIGKGNAGNIGANFLYLGVTNGIFTDSIGVGRVKDTTAPGGVLAFNPSFISSSPTAYFRGISGNTSRVTSWGIGDNGQNSSSSATTIGLTDFSGGTVDALVDVMFLGRDRQNGSAATLTGTLSFTAGIIDVNTLTIGNQTGTTTGSGCLGTVNVKDTNAKLVVNTTMELGHTTVVGGNALVTKGTLNITNGIVLANTVIVGTGSASNAINMVNGTLIVTNTLATNASGVAYFSMATNSTLGLTVAADASLKARVGTLTTGGATNYVLLASVPIFASYPTQFTLIQYTNSAVMGAGMNLGLTNIPATAPGAYLSNNTLSRSIDLVLPTAPYPAISAQPQGLAINPADTAVYTVTATGTPPLSYQWLKDGVPQSDGGNIWGTTTSTLTITNVTTGDNGFYSVVITNLYGAITSSPAILFVSASDVAPFITAEPVSLTVVSNQNASFSVGAAGKPLPAYQWLKNTTNLVDGGNISGATTPTLNIGLAQVYDEGTYSCVITNIAGITNSVDVTLTVNIPPVITVQPTNTSVLSGSSVCFYVTATGKPAPAYQWYKNGLPINDETNSTLCFGAAAPGDAGTYFVVVNNAAGTVTSSSVTLIVNSAMAASTFWPANNATGICPDTVLRLTFDTAPVIGTAGRIRIYNATNTATPVDTLDLSQNVANGTQPRAIAGIATLFNTYPVIVTGNTANIYPHSGVLTSNQTYYVTIENVVNGTFKDGAGATFAGITANNVWRFTTKPTGPANPTNIIVAADGTGDFCTVQGAADYLAASTPNRVTVNIRNGTYTEIVRINGKNNVTFRGQDRYQTVITYANNDSLNGGTAARPMLGVLSATDVALENLTLTNSTPKGGSQAEALYISGTRRFIAYHLDVASYQDTILLNANGDLAYLQDNYIQGDTDFIWGAATAFFTNCEVKTLNSGSVSSPQSITQARTAALTNGFSFVNCQLTRLNSGIINGSLGRSLGYTDGNVAYINCWIDGHIIGWVDALARSWEYGNMSYVTMALTNYNGVQLTNDDPRLLLAQDATNWLYGWQPQLAPTITSQPVGQSVSGGATATFTVVATGIPAPTYQWLKNGSNLLGQTSASLTINNANANDATTYAVVVSTPAGSITSTSATLTVGNNTPSLLPITDSTINAGANFTASAVASDPDVPVQTLTFSLLSNPANASINPSTGLFSWRPTVAQADTTNLVTIQVADNGSPSLTATQSFNVVVSPIIYPSLSSTVSLAGGQFSLTVDSGTAGPDYIVLASTDLINWTPIFTNLAPSLPFTSVVDTNAADVPVRFYRIQLAP